MGALPSSAYQAFLFQLHTSKTFWSVKCVISPLASRIYTNQCYQTLWQILNFIYKYLLSASNRIAYIKFNDVSLK